MVDKLSVAGRSVNMSKIRARDTKPELLVRRMLHKLGYRYAIHVKELAGKPDLVFTARRKVIFVHGCFWHQHDRADCSDARRPKSNTGYWTPKLSRNVERDAEHVSALQGDGWEVLTVWDCEMADAEALKQRLVDFLGAPKASCQWPSVALTGEFPPV